MDAERAFSEAATSFSEARSVSIGARMVDSTVSWIGEEDAMLVDVRGMAVEEAVVKDECIKGGDGGELRLIRESQETLITERSSPTG